MSSHLIAGVTAGVLTAIALHPLDVLKVRFQVQDGLVNRVEFTSLRAGVAGIWRSEGARGFYRGVIPAMWGSGAAWGLYFYFYEACKRRLAESRGGGALPATHLAYAAWEGGTITSLLTNPIWLVKTRMQLQGGGAGGALPPYRSMAHAFACILREEGPRGLYRGIVPALLLTSHGVVQFVVYELLKRSSGEGGGGGSGGGGFAHLFGAGLLSKAAATLLTYPYQVTKSRLQQRFAGAPEYTGFLDVVKKMWAREGSRGFYKGFAANLLRVAPQSALTLVVYESIQALVSGDKARALK